MLIFIIHRCQWIEGMLINYWLKKNLTEEESGHAALLLSLLKIREQQWSIPNFDRNEIEMMVEFICTAWFRLSMMYSLEQMSWFFFPCVNIYVCIILYGTNVSE